MAHFFMVSPEYLRVMGLAILRGRGLETSDRESSPRVLVVSDAFARRAFPGESAVGKRINWNDDVWEIVGVAADMRHESLASPFDADVYVPRRQVVRGNTWLLLKTGRSPAAVLQEFQDRARRIDPAVALTDAFTMRQRLDTNAAPERFRAIVTGMLAGLTLLLAVVGLHGVVCYAVTQRTREIGVRLALGQRPASIVWTIMRDTLRTIAVGAVPGILLSIYAGRWLSSVVMVDADSTSALAAVVAIFVAAALIAAAGPALRASRVDPVLALRT
jgi:putative ABC transport system permease protein